MRQKNFGFQHITPQSLISESQQLDVLLQSLEQQLGAKSTQTSLAFAQTLA